MDLRTLRYFLAVAEEQHFGRAALRLDITQPTLSQQVRRLEESLGVELLRRSSRHVELTPAGTALLPGARRVLSEAQRAAEAAQAAAAGLHGQLMVGAIGSALTDTLPAVLAELHQAVPQLRCWIEELNTVEQLQALSEGRLDVGLVRSSIGIPGLDFLDVVEEVEDSLIALLPTAHVLAEQRAISFEELASERFVLWPRRANPLFYDQIIASCREHGFSPEIVSEGGGFETQLSLVAAGIGISLQPASYRTLQREGITYRRLTDPTPVSTLRAVWRRHDPNPSLARFLAVLRRHAMVSQHPRN